MKCSLITPTYNWPEALELLLLSILNQSKLPDEVIIGDDGSDENTRSLIKHFQQKFPVPLIHIWHEDNGNRKPRMMNKAIAQAKYEYIIEIDGDIIMHKDFIKDHLRFAEKGYYLFGSRVNIQASILERVFSHKKIDFNFFSKGIKKRFRTVHFPLITSFIKPTAERTSKLRGCNMSFWKEDFIRVNGFNEDLKGWALEDSEMIQRLHNSGIKGKRLKFAGIVYHLYHPVQKRTFLEANKAIQEETTATKRTWIENGVDKFL